MNEWMCIYIPHVISSYRTGLNYWNIQKETFAKFFLPVSWKGVKKYEDSWWLHENVSNMRLCFMTSLLSWNIGVSRETVIESFVEKILLDLNTNLISLGRKCPRSSPAVRRKLLSCFSYFFFFPIAGLQRSIVKLPPLSWSTRLKTGS